LENTVFTRLSAAALFKFSELQMRRSFGGGAQLIGLSGAALNRINTVSTTSQYNQMIIDYYNYKMRRFNWVFYFVEDL
jgi:hypothetical protein